MYGFRVAIACAASVAAALGAAAQDGAHRPDQIDFSMFFEATVRDTPECDARVVDGDFVFGDSITNPAASCPDAFAWKTFAEVIRDGWWENWSTDRETFPSDPWPRCAPGETGNCCPAVTVSNDPRPEHCPVFPGPTPGVPAYAVVAPGTAHMVPLARAATRDLNDDGRKDWADVPAVLRNAVIGAVQNELVYRNAPMVRYIFDRGLYSTEGLAAVYRHFVEAIGAYAPRWPTPPDPTRSYPLPPATAAINFPVGTIMLKVNWLEADKAAAYGIDPDDQRHPYIVMDLVPQAEANAAPGSQPPAKTRFILLSMHISTKDLPNWFWATFEHVDNIGRCDWLGCNDSFGYINTETLEIGPGPTGGLAEPARNYTPPHSLTEVGGQQQDAFVLAERYSDVDRISERLDAVLRAYGIGTDTAVNRSGRPTVGDPAWRSYRLKGTETNFVTATGRANRLGNSVTEAGFVNSASCITCHARAGATAEGLPPLSIFADTLSDAGIPKSVNGIPEESWFNVNAYWGVGGEREAPGIRAVQTDFVWGFRFACPMAPMSVGPKWCANVGTK